MHYAMVISNKMKLIVFVVVYVVSTLVHGDVSHLHKNNYLPPTSSQSEYQQYSNINIHQQSQASDIGSHPNPQLFSPQVESIRPSVPIASFTIQTEVPLSQLRSSQTSAEQSQSNPTSLSHYEHISGPVSNTIDQSHNDFDTFPNQQSSARQPRTEFNSARTYLPPSPIGQSESPSTNEYLPPKSAPLRHVFSVPKDVETSNEIQQESSEIGNSQPEYTTTIKNEAQYSNSPVQVNSASKLPAQNEVLNAYNQGPSVGSPVAQYFVQQTPSAPFNGQQQIYSVPPKSPNTYLPPPPQHQIQQSNPKALVPQNYAPPPPPPPQTQTSQPSPAPSPAQQTYSAPQGPSRTYLPPIQDQVQQSPSGPSVYSQQSYSPPTQIQTQQVSPATSPVQQTYSAPQAPTRTYLPPIQDQVQQTPSGPAAQPQQNYSPPELSQAHQGAPVQQNYSPPQAPQRTYLPPTQDQIQETPSGPSGPSAVPTQSYSPPPQNQVHQNTPAPAPVQHTYSPPQAPTRTYLPPTQYQVQQTPSGPSGPSEPTGPSGPSPALPQNYSPPTQTQIQQVSPSTFPQTNSVPQAPSPTYLQPTQAQSQEALPSPAPIPQTYSPQQTVPQTYLPPTQHRMQQTRPATPQISQENLSNAALGLQSFLPFLPGQKPNDASYNYVPSSQPSKDYSPSSSSAIGNSDNERPLPYSPHFSGIQHPPLSSLPQQPFNGPANFAQIGQPQAQYFSAPSPTQPPQAANPSLQQPPLTQGNAPTAIAHTPATSQQQQIPKPQGSYNNAPALEMYTFPAQQPMQSFPQAQAIDQAQPNPSSNSIVGSQQGSYNVAAGQQQFYSSHIPSIPQNVKATSNSPSPQNSGPYQYNPTQQVYNFPLPLKATPPVTSATILQSQNIPTGAARQPESVSYSTNHHTSPYANYASASVSSPAPVQNTFGGSAPITTNQYTPNTPKVHPEARKNNHKAYQPESSHQYAAPIYTSSQQGVPLTPTASKGRQPIFARTFPTSNQQQTSQQQVALPEAVILQAPAPTPKKSINNYSQTIVPKLANDIDGTQYASNGGYLYEKP